jgi:hypothetical protein
MAEMFLVPYGGLGNQLFQCAAALSLGQGNSVTVLSDWGYARRDLKGQLELQSYEWDGQIVFADKPKLGKLSKRALNLLLRLGAENRITQLKVLEMFLSPYFSFRLRRFLKIQVNIGVGFSDLDANRSKLLIGYFQCTQHLSNIKKNMMKLSLTQISTKAKNLLAEIREKSTLVIHIRRGDYVNERFGVLENQYYLEAIQRLNLKNYDQTWIFSDDILSAREMTFFKSIENVEFVDDKYLSSSEILEIMRYGAGFVIANSSLSWWAAQLRHKVDADVICPSPWFKYVDSPKGIIDREWHLIQW